MLGHEVLRLAQVLGRVDREPDALVTKASQLALLSEVGERRRLVVALVREAGERLVAESVDAGVDPVVEEWRLAEAGDAAVVLELDDAERRADLRDHDRRAGAVRVLLGEERRKVDVEQLVAVEREHGAGLLAVRRCELQPAAAPERLGLADGDDLRTDASERVHERLLLAGAAGDDHPGHAGEDEPRNRVLREREAADRDKRLWQALRRLPKPLRLAPGEEQSLYRCSSGSRSSGSAGVACLGRPIPS